MSDSDIMDELEDNDLETMEDVSNKTADGSASDISALRDNIKQKGTNSYYYAHKTIMDGPVWDGKEEPRKIGDSTSTADITPLNSSFDTITEYLWSDEDKNIKIYIEQPNASTIDDAVISLVSSCYRKSALK
jgi:hypothetical protein